MRENQCALLGPLYRISANSESRKYLDFRDVNCSTLERGGGNETWIHKKVISILDQRIFYGRCCGEQAKKKNQIKKEKHPFTCQNNDCIRPEFKRTNSVARVQKWN